MVMALLAASLASGRASAETIADAYQRALKHHYAGRYDKAVADFERAAEAMGVG